MGGCRQGGDLLESYEQCRQCNARAQTQAVLPNTCHQLTGVCLST